MTAWLPISILLQLQIIRVGLFGVMFGYLYFADYLAHKWATDGVRKPGDAVLTTTFLLSTLTFVTVLVLTTHVPFADIMVAFAPGAMDAMLALALTLHIDPIFVGAHHLSRFVFVTIATPGILHLFGRPQEDVDD